MIQSARYWMILLALFAPVQVIAEDTRLEVPKGAELQQAAKLVEEVFGMEIKAARTAEQRLAVTNKLRAEAGRSADDPAARYALLRAAADAAPDAAAALAVIDQIGKAFQIDTLKDKASTVWQHSKSAKSPADRKVVAGVASQLMDDAVALDDFDTAEKLGTIALALAEKAKDFQLVNAIRAKTAKITRQAQNYTSVQSALATLQTNPTDQEANMTVGKYLCLVKEDWDEGLPMLALGNDAQLKAIATKEIKSPSVSKQQLELADAWFDAGNASSGMTKERMLRRALHWYQKTLRSQPALSRLEMAKIEKRMPGLVEAPAADNDTESSNVDGPRKVKIRANGFAVRQTINCAAGERRLTAGRSFTVLRPWTLHVEALPKTLASPYQMVIFWGDGRGGLDPFYLRFQGRRLVFGWQDCRSGETAAVAYDCHLKEDLGKWIDVLTSSPKLDPVCVRESFRAVGPERILSDESETTFGRSDHFKVTSCGRAS